MTRALRGLGRPRIGTAGKKDTAVGKLYDHGAPISGAASGGEGRLADNGKRISDLLPACIEALFAQQPPPAGTGASSGASPDSCAAAQ